MKKNKPGMALTIIMEVQVNFYLILNLNAKYVTKMSKMKKSGVSFAERTAKTEEKLSKIPKKQQKTQVF